MNGFSRVHGWVMFCQGLGTLWDLRAIGIHGDVTRMKGLRFMPVCSPALLGDATNDWHLLAFRVSITLSFVSQKCVDR